MRLTSCYLVFLCTVALGACEGAESEPKNPTTDVTDSSDPSDTSDPTDPADTSDTADPSDPTDTSDASDTSDPTDTSDQSDTSDPTDTSDESDTSEPEDLCGNGVLDPGEICDGSDCPTACDDENACTSDLLIGSADTCDAVCSFEEITTCESDDGCCAAGCDANSDNDCSATCGNGIIEAGETCDGDCPMSCDDQNQCTADTVIGSASTCDATCSNAPVTACVDDDGCCPSGCVASTDNDCSDPLAACEGTLDFIADGFCDGVNNNEACTWDGGDCCASTCVSAQYTCGGYVDPVTGDNFDCQDPAACENLEEGCTECSPGCATESVGNGTCDPLCYTVACSYDAPTDGVSDCSCAEVGLNQDCAGECFGDERLDWVGDGICDDGEYGLDLNCDDWTLDGGDCEEPADPTDSSDPPDPVDPTDPDDSTDPSETPDPTDPADPSCNAEYLGDGWCDEANNTDVCGWDNGDCCRSTCTDGQYTCGLFTEYVCLDPNACENREEGCSDQDNLSCEERGLNEDCNGICFPDEGLSWLADGECDEGQWSVPLSFNCPAWSYDNGDCEAPDPGDERENVTITLTVDYFFSQATWMLEQFDGTPVSENQFFTTFNEVQAVSFNLDSGEYCVSISDSYADGGVSGNVAVNGVIAISWDADDYGDEGSFCFTVD